MTGRCVDPAPAGMRESDPNLSYMDQHPVYLTDNGNNELSRLTTLFRPIMVIPHYIWAGIWGIAAAIVWFVAWIVSIFTGRVPEGMHSFLRNFVIFNCSWNSYAQLQTNEWPPFDATEYDIWLHVPETPQQQGRLGILFRGIMAIPAAIVIMFYAIGAYFATIGGWIMGIITAEYPAGWRAFAVRTNMRGQQLAAYQFLLTDAYPQMGEMAGPEMVGGTPVAPQPTPTATV